MQSIEATPDVFMLPAGPTRDSSFQAHCNIESGFSGRETITALPLEASNYIKQDVSAPSPRRSSDHSSTSTHMNSEPLYETSISSIMHENNSSANTSVMEKEEVPVEVVEVKKRGWRFYGTFACLALLNLVCAIDATILSVALPVRNLSFRYIR
jgi:hypothetical protein